MQFENKQSIIAARPPDGGVGNDDGNDGGIVANYIVCFRLCCLHMKSITIINIFFFHSHRMRRWQHIVSHENGVHFD